MPRRVGLLFWCLVATPLFAQPFPEAWVDASRSIPVAAEGRVLPLETWARILSARAGQNDADAAVNWLLTLLVFPEAASGPSVANLASTFSWDDPASLRSPFLVFPGAQALNPAQAMVDLPKGQRDRLGLLLLWREQARAAAWSESAEAARLFAGTTVALEVFHNHLPWVWILLSLGLIGWAMGRWVPNRFGVVGARGSIGLAWVLMTAWLIVRMVISGRPPVTNLPSTFLLVSWLLLSVSLFLSWRTSQKLVAEITLFGGTLLPLVSLAFPLPDPFAPVQAVLNSNFWLSIHVTVIVAGYAAALLAGILGHTVLGLTGLPKASRELVALTKGLRWTLLAALALTATGTLLGGFWADQSWGRFWGWDPKENGALLLILWLALTIHLKPAGWAQDWGTALAAALLIPALLFSWLGVNLLGQGFHSYGAAPGKTLLFGASMAADGLVISFFILRRVLH